MANGTGEIRAPSWLVGLLAAALSAGGSYVAFRSTTTVELEHQGDRVAKLEARVESEVQRVEAKAADEAKKLSERLDGVQGVIGKVQFNLWALCQASRARCPYPPAGDP